MCFDDPKDDLSHGKRGCTDLLCLSVFFIFIGIMIIISSFAFVYGNPYRLSNGYDSFGNVCGRKNEPLNSMKYTGFDMTDRNYVFFFNVWDPFNSVKLCVKKCPDQKLSSFEEMKMFSERTSSSLCYDLSMSQYERGNFVMNQKWQYVCPNLPVYESVPVMNRCIPKTTKDVSLKIIYSIHSYLNNIEFLQQLFTDFYNSWVTMVWLIALSVVISLCVILSLHYYAFIISWTILIASIIGATVLTIILWVTLMSIEKTLDDTPAEERLDKMVRNETAFLIYALLASVITLVLIGIAIYIRNKIRLMVDLFQQASKCIRYIPCLLLQPLWTCISLTIFLIFWLSVMLSLATSNRSSLLHADHLNHSQNLTHLPITFPSFQFVDRTWIQSMWWFYVIAFIWGCEFILAFQQMVIARAVALWYFQRNKKNLKWPLVRAFRKVFFYHIGSLAMGSFLITIFKVPRLILTFIDNRLKKDTPEWCRCCVKCCGVCCWCCLHALEKFIRYMNHNAYTIVVCRGTNFCGSAKLAYQIVIEHIIEFAVIDKAGDCVLFFGKCFVTIVTGIIGLLYMQHDPELYFYAGPILVVCSFAYFIAHCFFSIYEMVIDTLFLCLCEDYHLEKTEGNTPFADDSLSKFMKERRSKLATIAATEL